MIGFWLIVAASVALGAFTVYLVWLTYPEDRQ